MIKLSRLADYGIVIMTELARQPRRALSASEIAVATHVPAPTTSKILKQLARAGLVTSQRGVHGGYAMSRAAQTISVAEVIEALDGPIALTECSEPSLVVCGLERLCPARGNWQRINDAIRDALAGISLAEMASSIPEAFMTMAVRRPDPAPVVRHPAGVG